MTESELEQVILENIMDIYKMEYIGKLKVTKLNPKGYEIKLGMNTPEAPFIIYGELEDEQFLKFLKEELRNRKLDTVFYGICFKTMPLECNQVNRACSCNDKRRTY